MSLVVCNMPVQCLCYVPVWLNDFWHILHWNGFSPVCINWWCFRCWPVLKFFFHVTQITLGCRCWWLCSSISLTQYFSHWPHANAPWVVICLVRTPFRPNDFSHVLHLKRLSPVWTTWCFLKRLAFLRLLPHMLQETEFGFMWTPMWFFNRNSSTKVLLQWWQESGLSPEWYLLCLYRVPTCVKDLLHCLHEKDFLAALAALCPPF